jgi:hypothetical protein
MRSREETPVKRGRIHEYLSFRAAVKTDAGTAAAAPTDESKVRIARDPGTIPRGTPLTGRYRQIQFRLSTFLLANSLQRLSKRQFVAIRIEHVEIAFTP